MKPVQVMPTTDLRGRVDIFLYRLAEVASRKLEARFNMPGIWDGFARPIMDEKIQEFEGMGPVEFARKVGFLKPERKRRKLKGAA
jgi:hypothetical protein